jgi:hypothetical protein
MLVTITPSWGQPTCASPGCNPTVSDALGNTAGGTGALGSLGTTGENTAFGNNALSSNTTGFGNTATGYGALQANTTGFGNAAHGNDALASNAIGGRNTALGEEALRGSTGNKNIGIGYKAGVRLTSGNNNIYVDNLGESNESQTIRLGDTQGRTFIAGIITANVAGTTVEIDGNGQLGIKNSSARYKRDIETMASRSEGLLKLRPVTFVYKDDASAAPRYGLIAEEVATVYPELVTRTATGEVQTVKYHELIPMLLNELQRQRQSLERQEREMDELATLRKDLAELRSLLGPRASQ